MGCNRVRVALVCVITAVDEFTSFCRRLNEQIDGLATDLVVQTLLDRCWTQSFP